LAPDDTVLLCSDGLTGVVDDETIVATLTTSKTPAQAIDALIAKANQNGGPDNVTVLVLTYEDEDSAVQSTVPIPIPIRSRHDRPDSDFARDLGRVGMLGRSGPVYTQTHDSDNSMRSIFTRALTIVLGISLLLGVIIGGGQFLLSRSVYVGVDDGEVVIFRGVNADLGPVALSRVQERSGIMLDEVMAYYHPILEAGRPATDLSEARRLLLDLPRTSTDPPPGQIRN